MPWIADLPLLGAPHRLLSLAGGIKALSFDYPNHDPEPHRPAAVWFGASDGTVVGLATAEHGDHFALAVGTLEELSALGVAVPAADAISWRAWPLGASAIGVFMALCVDSSPDEDGAIIVRVGVRAMAQRGETLRDTEHPHHVGDGIVFSAPDGRRLVVTSAPYLNLNVFDDAPAIDEALELGRLWPLRDYLETYHPAGPASRR
ncbi:hypothetical protein sos41_24220 [Alphaproteobacteria bacterium SO-S41]|nr:hypothetical protein sos41_24220 [Alphaproteobacteria bacterium SO-S41]